MAKFPDALSLLLEVAPFCIPRVHIQLPHVNVICRRLAVLQSSNAKHDVSSRSASRSPGSAGPENITQYGTNKPNTIPNLPGIPPLVPTCLRPQWRNLISVLLHDPIDLPVIPNRPFHRLYVLRHVESNQAGSQVRQLRFPDSFVHEPAWSPGAHHTGARCTSPPAAGDAGASRLHRAIGHTDNGLSMLLMLKTEKRAQTDDSMRQLRFLRARKFNVELSKQMYVR